VYEQWHCEPRDGGCQTALRTLHSMPYARLPSHEEQIEALWKELEDITRRLAEQERATNEKKSSPQK